MLLPNRVPPILFLHSNLIAIIFRREREPASFQYFFSLMGSCRPIEAWCSSRTSRYMLLNKLFFCSIVTNNREELSMQKPCEGCCSVAKVYAKTQIGRVLRLRCPKGPSLIANYLSIPIVSIVNRKFESKRPATSRIGT